MALRVSIMQSQQPSHQRSLALDLVATEISSLAMISLITRIQWGINLQLYVWFHVSNVLILECLRKEFECHKTLRNNV
jgi:hypothetical protein